MLESLKKNTMGMNMHKIVKQMEIFDPKNWVKIVTFDKWLTMTSN
jgi:hypothetical protein